MGPVHVICPRVIRWVPYGAAMRAGGRLVWVLRALAGGVVVALAGCAGGASVSPPRTVVVTQTVTPTPAAASGADVAAQWPALAARAFTGSAPQFPVELVGWRLVEQWDPPMRAFTGQWSAVAASDGSTFPATMNGCATSRFLVRWRALNPAVEVTARWVDAAGGASSNSSGESGWMVADGCHTPELGLTQDGADGSTLTDIAVSVQHWSAAP